MEAYLAGQSAFDIWNSVSIKEERASNLFDIPKDHIPAISKAEAEALTEEFGLQLPIDVAASSGNSRRNSKRVKTTLHAASSPAHQYMKIREGLFAARPELCLMQLAERCSQMELIYKANVLAGCFTFTQQEHFQPRWPSTSQSAIKQFLERCGKCNGKGALVKAAPYVIDCSYSPMETVLALLLCLPQRHGGYGIPLPTLNQKVKLASLRGDDVPTQTFRPDLLWDEHRLIIEYDSAKWHADERKAASDATRRNMLICNGYTVLSMTPEQLFNLSIMDELGCYLAKVLKRPAPKLSPDALQQRRALREELFEAAGLQTD